MLEAARVLVDALGSNRPECSESAASFAIARSLAATSPKVFREDAVL